MYKDTLDIKGTKTQSKLILEEFSTLMTLLKNDFNIKSSWNFDKIVSFTTFVNTDLAMCEKIEKRDLLIQQINAVLVAFNLIPDLEEIALLKYKYVQLDSDTEIENKMKIGRNTRIKIYNSALINFAIAISCEVQRY